MAPYCNVQWDSDTCGAIENQGSCIYLNNQCEYRAVYLPTVNVGVNCRHPCDAENNANQQCSFCGTAGICCDILSPDGCVPIYPDDTLMSYTCAVPGTSTPTLAPIGTPTIMPTSVSPTSQAPTSLSPTTSVPTNMPSSLAPTTMQPSSTTPTTSPISVSKIPTKTPSVSPTRQPTFFGSTVYFSSTSGQFEVNPHASEEFKTHLCNIFTVYWFPSKLSCDPLSVTIIVTDASSTRRRLATNDLPNVQVVYQLSTIPENTTAVALGYDSSNYELSVRASFGQYGVRYEIAPYGSTTFVATPNPAAQLTSTASITTTSWIYIGVGIGCFVLLMIVIFLLIRRRQSNSDENRRNDNLYIPPRRSEVRLTRGEDFRSTPSGQRDYISDEINQHRGGRRSEASKSMQKYPTQSDARSFISATESSRSYPSEPDERTFASRPENRRSISRAAVGVGGGRERVRSIHDQMSPYFQGSPNADQYDEEFPPEPRNPIAFREQMRTREYEAKQPDTRGYTVDPRHQERAYASNPAGSAPNFPERKYVVDPRHLERATSTEERTFEANSGSARSLTGRRNSRRHDLEPYNADEREMSDWM
jgi:hypothetical protein